MSMSASFLDSPLAKHSHKGVVHSPSRNSDSPTAVVDRDVVLTKCRSVIEALHEELEEERSRGERLERSLLQERQLVRQLEARHAEQTAELQRRQEDELGRAKRAISARDAELAEQASVIQKQNQEVSVSTSNLDALAEEHSKLLAELATKEKKEKELRASLSRKTEEVAELEKTVVAISEELLKAKPVSSQQPVWDETKVERLRGKLENKILTLKLKLNELLDQQEASQKLVYAQQPLRSSLSGPLPGRHQYHQAHNHI